MVLPCYYFTINCHFLLHLPEIVRRVGPLQTVWMFASERFQSTVASRVMEMAELFRWHFPSRNTNRQTDLKRLEMMPHFEEDRQGRRQLLNEFHERPAEDQLATMEDWPPEGKFRCPIGHVRGRDGQMGHVHAGTGTWTTNSKRHKPFPTVSQVEGVFVELWELQPLGSHALSRLQKVRKMESSVLVIDLKRNIFMT